MHARVLIPLILLAVLTIAPTARADDAAFSTRFAQTARGDITAVGNTLMTCPPSAVCTQAQARTGAKRNNNDHNMILVDADSDASTASSSAAGLTLPAGATVLWAGLYWAADTSAGTGGTAADAAQRGTVAFKVPGGAYADVTAATGDVLTSTPQPTRYRAFADVTALVAAAGNGTYWVGNVAAGTGADRFAGWALTVAYRDATQSVHRLQVYDGLGTVDATHTWSTTVAPFFTPAGGAVRSSLGLLSFEGDMALVGETATFDGQPWADAGATPLNPADNTMNSTISRDGVLAGDKLPDYANQLGMDLDSRTVTGLLDNGQSSADLVFTSNQDYFMPSMFFVVTDEGPPAAATPPTVSGTAQDGTTLSADPGDWNGTPDIDYAYQWQLCDAAGDNCTDIAGATDATYTPGAGAIDHTIRVVVVASNDAGDSAPASSAPTAVVVAPAPAVNDSAPSTGATPPAVGGTLTADPGDWSGVTDDTTYQWLLCDADGEQCEPIEGATDPTYTVGPGDAGSTIVVVVTVTNPGGSTSVTSPPSAVVPYVPASAGGATPAIGSSGGTLTATPPDWSGSGPIDTTYQWQLCDAAGQNCVDIPGATGPTYTPGPPADGHTIVVIVTGSGPGGSTTVTSAPFGPFHAPGTTPPATPATPATPAEDECQQLVGGAKYRRVAIAGIGNVRVRAYTSGTARISSPMRVSTTIHRGGAASVGYTLDGRRLDAAGQMPYAAAVTPRRLGHVGRHVLQTRVVGRRGATATIVLTLRTVPCQTLFTAQRWRTAVGTGLRLRVDARTALRRAVFRLPRVLLPHGGSPRRTIGFMRVWVAGRDAPARYVLRLGRGRLLGHPRVRLAHGALRLDRLPVGIEAAELTLYRSIRLDGAPSHRRLRIRASVRAAGVGPAHFAQRPRAPR
jgi:hypothetical protein